MKSRISFLLLFVLSVINLQAQNFEKSPISRFGIGDLQPFSSSWIQQMGGLGLGVSSENMVNPSNPASQAFLRQTDMEIAVHARYKEIKDGANNKSKDWSGNLDHIWLGIPLRNSINELLDRKTYKQSVNLILGLSPFSTTGSSYQVNDSNTFGKISRVIENTGPLNAFTFGVAYRYKNFGAGLHLSYLFGNIRYFQQLSLDDVPGSSISFLDDQYHVNGWRPNLGLAYKKVINKSEIKKDKSTREQILSFGLNMYLPSRINFSRNSLYVNQWKLDETFQDTILYVKNQTEEGNLPFGVGAGIYFSNKEHSGWQISAQSEFWESATLHAKSLGELTNSFQLSAGGWSRKNTTGYGNFFQRSFFRYGVYYKNDYRKIQNETITQYGIQAGVGIPLVFLRQDATVHFGLQYGKQTAGKLLNEDIFQFNFGISLNDNEWFLKRRYN